MGITNLRTGLSRTLNRTATGNRLLYYYRRWRGRLPAVDPDFPSLVAFEISSVCNLSCIHCAPQQHKADNRGKQYGFLEYGLFARAMDEIDGRGRPLRIALHKDGEPLLHPEIIPVLRRVKQNRPHQVYLATNGHFLTAEITAELLRNRIDIVNFSIGAATPETYRRIRGGRGGAALTTCCGTYTAFWPHGPVTSSSRG